MRAERNNGTVKVSISQRPPYVQSCRIPTKLQMALTGAYWRLVAYKIPQQIKRPIPAGIGLLDNYQCWHLYQG